MTVSNKLLPGDNAPWFQAPALNGSNAYAFSTVAGRHVLMLFFGSARIEASGAALATVRRNRDVFDDSSACFFGVTVDPDDAASGRIEQQLPGIRYFLDYDRKVSTLYGAAAGEQYRPHWLVLDPALRVLRAFGIRDGEEAITYLRSELARPAATLWAPVLRVPDVLEPEICRSLIELYEAEGGEDSGFMRDVEGRTVGIIDHGMKQRRDCPIPDGPLKQAVVGRISRRLRPAISRAFQFEATRIERYIVACYEANAGHFRPHRDNTTKGTAHRKFAVSINLNSDFEGGDLRFPEFGSGTYRPPSGGAIVFSCSLLHEATPVTRGRRFAFLPFLYDEAAARLRQANSAFVAGEAAAYTAGPAPV